MEKKLSPVYRINQGLDPRYDEMFAQIAKHLPPDAEDPEQHTPSTKITADERAKKDKEMDLGDYEKSYGE